VDFGEERAEQHQRLCYNSKGEKITIFKTITYLESGNDIQCRAFKVINELKILNDMA
jgi:hypothetical protein